MATTLIEAGVVACGLTCVVLLGGWLWALLVACVVAVAAIEARS